MGETLKCLCDDWRAPTCTNEYEGIIDNKTMVSNSRGNMSSRVFCRHHWWLTDSIWRIPRNTCFIFSISIEMRAVCWTNQLCQSDSVKQTIIIFFLLVNITFLSTLHRFVGRRSITSFSMNCEWAKYCRSSLFLENEVTLGKKANDAIRERSDSFEYM